MLQIRFGMRLSHPELEGLICAAISNRRIASLLLTNPEAALVQLEQRDVQLSPTERAMVTSITGAADIHEFAAQLHAKVQQRMEVPSQRLYSNPT